MSIKFQRWRQALKETVFPSGSSRVSVEMMDHG